MFCLELQIKEPLQLLQLIQNRHIKLFTINPILYTTTCSDVLSIYYIFIIIYIIPIYSQKGYNLIVFFLSSNYFSFFKTSTIISVILSNIFTHFSMCP